VRRDGYAVVHLVCESSSPCRGSLHLSVERPKRTGHSTREEWVPIGRRGYGLAGHHRAGFAVRLATSEQSLLDASPGGLRVSMRVTEKLYGQEGAGEPSAGPPIETKPSAPRRETEILAVRLRRE
jgi:hypothetical protein